MLLQFTQHPTVEVVNELKANGVIVLGDVPVNGLLVSVPAWTEIPDLDLQFTGTLLPEDKISPLITTGDPSTWSGYFLVEFHADIDINAARGLLLNLGVELHENPDLTANHLMIRVGEENRAQLIARLVALDQVAYLFPASRELADGFPVRACNGALTTNGAVTQSIPTFGDGWDGPGRNPVTLTYVWGNLTSKLDPTAAKGEILRAMADWSKTVDIKWQSGTAASGLKTIHILFAAGDHGDGFPFDKAGGVLAHTFYPAPPNPEPIAGDFHLDDAEAWRIGANTDLYSVALHELGHALGLGHSDDPTAVMYPYYRMATGLSDADKAAILTLYAATNTSTNPTQTQTPTPTPTPAPTPTPTPTPAPTPSPLILTVNAPVSPTTATTVSLTGSASGGSGAIGITWTSSTGSKGTAAGSIASWVASIPLVMGTNTITVTAAAGASRVARAITIVRSSTTSGSGDVDTTPPTINLSVPSSATASTSAKSFTISGTASDNSGVKSVVWSSNFGTSGSATGTNSWSATIPLLQGANTITIRAYDFSGNSSWRTVVLSRR